MITATRVRDAEALERLAPEWADLVQRAADATPFARPEWKIPWWRRFGSGTLHCLPMRAEGGRLAGVLAFFVHEWDGRRQATLVGNGITDYLGLIAEPGAEIECARAVYRYLADIRSEWDLCDWQDLSEDSPLIRCAPAGFWNSLEDDRPCMRAALPCNADEWEASLPHGLRRTVRVSTRRLERDGDLLFETLESATQIRELFHLHEIRWAMKGGPASMLDQSAVQEFLVDAAVRFAAAGKLRLYTMRVNGGLEAVILAVLDRNRAWGYITGMNPGLSRFSPGSLVLNYAMREAIREGAVAWEFLRGDEQYKSLWGAQIVPKKRLCLWQSKRFAPAPTSADATEPGALVTA
jgi:CelD/BcsL family acetyltransferase involved in cellulose biosynthesis